jgi:Domain of unknown function (DUF4118)
MNRFVDDRRVQVVALVFSAAAPFAVALALVPVRGHVPNATVALALAVLVTVLGAVGTRGTAALAAISAGVGFDVFHTHPYGSLTITRGQDIETTVLLLAVGLVVGQVAARNRRYRVLVAETSYDLGRIHAVAEMVAAGAPVDQVVLAVSNELADLLGLQACRFDSHFANDGGPFIERHGAVTWGALRWGFATTGLPHHDITLVVQYQGLPLGRFVLLAPPGKRVSGDQLVAAVALADLAGAAVAAQGVPGAV